MFTEAEQEAISHLELEHRFRIGDDKTAPLVFLVHGRAGDYNVMSAFRRCIPDSFNVIIPQAPFDDPIGGYSWWMIGLDRVKMEHDAYESADILEHFIEESIKYYDLSPKKIIAFGFSQGGAVLSLMLQEEPEQFAGIALLASFVVKVPEMQPVSDKAAKVFIGHGEVDRIVTLDRAEDGSEYLKNLNYEVEFYLDKVGHKIGTDGMRALKKWAHSFE